MVEFLSLNGGGDDAQGCCLLLAIHSGKPTMVVDFQHHYTPPELMETGKGDGSLRLDENGNPNYRFNPLLADLSAHVRMMDKAGIDVAVLSCGSGFAKLQPKSQSWLVTIAKTSAEAQRLAMAATLVAQEQGGLGG